MKPKQALSLLLFLLLLLAGYTSPPLFAQGTAFTYQGRLESSGVPFTGNAEFQPTLWDAATNGTQVAANNPSSIVVSVTNGLFVLPLDFGANFPGAGRWLQLGVRTSIGSFTTLSPRQQITPAPYAITANLANNSSNLLGSLSPSQLSGLLPSANLGGSYSNAVTLSNAGNSFSGNGTGLTALNASHLTSGTVPAAVLGNAWKTGGNAGTTAGTQFIGTTDNQPLELRVNDQRALRLEPNTNGAPNVVGGSSANFVAPGVSGATIGGGGTTNYLGLGLTFSNSVSADFGTVGGGAANTASNAYATVGGGFYNSASGYGATVGGGGNNTASGNSATMGGGGGNTASGDGSTVGGGFYNSASGYGATVGAGESNIASGYYATVAGGSQNRAWGDGSFAAGTAAVATFNHSFVWSDGSQPFFSSTADDQFNVVASGGIRLLGDVELGLFSYDYHPLRLGGGNSSGYLYGSYPALADGIHLGYNYYYDANGTGHIINTGGGTSRLTVGYGFVGIYVGGVNLPPTTQRLRATSTGVEVDGTFNNNSDRNAKQDFAPVSSSQILDEVLRLPLSEWSYKTDPKTRHVGPMAQDFYAAFDIGTDDKHIAPIDEGGVAFAAIQGLNEKVEARTRDSQSRIRKLEAENVKLMRDNELLEKRLDALERIILNRKLN